MGVRARRDQDRVILHHVCLKGWHMADKNQLLSVGSRWIQRKMAFIGSRKDLGGT